MSELTMVRIKKDLLKKIKVQAAVEEKTVQEWLNQALVDALKKKK